MKKILIHLLGLLLLISCKVTQYEYALVSDRDANLDLYVSMRDKALHNVTNDKFVDYGIKWSPDGKSILFAKQVNKQYDLYLYNLTSSTTDQLTNDTNDQYGPSFSPDHIKQLTSDSLDNRWPRWTPDGKYLAYTRVENHSDIWIMDKNGKHKKQYVSSPKRDEILEFNPLKQKKGYRKHNATTIRRP